MTKKVIYIFFPLKRALILTIETQLFNPVAKTVIIQNIKIIKTIFSCEELNTKIRS